MAARIDIHEPGGIAAFPRPQDSYGFRLWHVLHAWQRRVERILAPLDLTHMQFVVLSITWWLESNGETPSQSRIAGFGKIDRMTLSNVLRLLEDKEYVERRPHPDDPRANWVSLTRSGQATMAEAKRIVCETQDAFFGRLSPEGQAALREQLDALMRWEGCEFTDAALPAARSKKIEA